MKLCFSKPKIHLFPRRANSRAYIQRTRPARNVRINLGLLNPVRENIEGSVHDSCIGQAIYKKIKGSSTFTLYC